MKLTINDTIPYGITIEHEKLKLNIQAGSKGEIVITSGELREKMGIGLIGSKNSHVNASHIFIEQPKEEVIS